MTGKDIYDSGRVMLTLDNGVKTVEMNKEGQEVLADIFTNSERPDKMSITLEPASRTVKVTYEGMDEEWFKELVEAISLGLIAPAPANTPIISHKQPGN